MSKQYDSARRRAYWAANPQIRARQKARAREIRYGLTQQEQDDLYRAQDGRCAACLKDMPQESIHLDHDHSTGRARNFLCPRCNKALSVLEDQELFARLTEYLRWHS